MRLEDKVTGGRVTYIEKVERSLNDTRIEFFLQGCPPTGDVDRVLTFFEVQAFGETWHDGEELGIIDMLIGIEERAEGVGTRYFIHTDTREFSLLCSAAPEVRRVG